MTRAGEVVQSPEVWEPNREELRSTKFHCDVCAAHKQPALQTAAKSPKTYTFNAIVSLDLLFLNNPITFQEKVWLNMVDWGSGYQLVDLLPNRERSAAKLGCMHHAIDCKSPWQNGRCERAGGEYKRQLCMACTEAGVSSSDEYGISVGYQPELPQSLIEDDKAAM
eukprot:2791451-Amphidinium_carterae.1